MGCHVTSGFAGQLIGIVLDSVIKAPIVGAVISSPCFTGTEILSGNDGSFMFPLVPAGLYDFNIAKAGYTTKSYPDYELFPNKTSFLQVELVMMATGIAGNVFLANSDPTLTAATVSGVTVKLQKDRAVIASQNSDNGLFSFSNLTPGNYTIIGVYQVGTSTTYRGKTTVNLLIGQELTGVNVSMVRL